MPKLYFQRGTLRSVQAYVLAFFAAFLISTNVSADDCCDIDLPHLSAENGCAVVDADPVGVCGDEVEWMWARNYNGSIYAETGWSTNQDQTFCPDESGDYRICARVVGCSTIIESGDVHVNIDAVCNAQITGVYIYDQSTDAPAAGLPALGNGVEINLNQLPAHYYIAVEVSGGEQSVELTFDGDSNTENVIPYTTPGGAENGGSLNLTAGDYSIDAAAYQNDNASGALCDEVHIDFSVVSDECVTITNGSSPYPSDDPIFQQVIADDSYCCYTWWDDTCEDAYIDHATTGELDETCVLDGYQYPSGRIFWLPGFGTDFKASGDGLFFDKFDDGTARIYGTVERIADNNKKFEVSIWFHNLSTYNEWIAQGGEAKSPELGDETNWIFYSQDVSKTSYLKGLNGLNGELLYILPQNNNYGLQIGDGANDLNANANGMSMWFDYEGTTSGHGDINATYDCQEDPLPSVNTFSLDCEDALKVAIEGVGMEGQNCADLDISYNEGNVEYIILEAVWKGWNPPATITFTADGNEYVAAAQSVLEGNGNDQGNKRAYRVEVPAASNVGVCVPNGFNNNLRSFVAYTFRSGAGSVSAGSGEFVGRHLYNDSYTMTLTVPAADAPRDIVVTMPISDMSEDGRFADFNVTAGPVNKHYAVTGNTNGLSLNIVPFVLENVPGDVTEVVIDLISDPNRNPNPSSFLAAGLAIADAQCDTPEEESVCEVIGFNGPGTRHFIFFSAFGTNFTSGPEGLSFIRYADGTAKMTGEIYAINNPNKIFDVVLYFENESTYDEFVAAGGEAKLENGATLADAQDWTYYVFDQDRPNVLTGRGDLEGEYLFFRQMDGMPYGLQVGSNGANGKNDEFGLSTWFSYSGTAEGDGDINANLLCAEPVCEVQCPEDLELDCESATHPDFTGYPTLICAENAGCVREAGEFDFEFQGWGGSTDGWSFGPGWDVGTGCDPACGDIPNVFIDFTNFHTAYNTKLKSPMYDACCTDEVSLSFCMQQDLYGGEDVPGILKVQYRVNGGNWITLETFESEYGSTINYERDYVLDGAEGNNFEVRFKAFGDGSSEYTMGGWGIDDVRVYGQTSGCSAGEEEVSVDWSFTDESNGSCPEVITRTFTATYQGENVECVQTLTLIDDTAPIFNDVPEDITFACASDVVASSASALDNCSDEVTVTSEDIVNGSGCVFTIDRVFTATDDCGNTATYTQVITVSDEEAPMLIGVPDDMTVECDQIPDAAVVTATDNCTDNVNVELVEDIEPLDCGFLLIRTWTAQDDCGNLATAEQTLTVTDTTAPVIAEAPDDVSINCDEAEPSDAPVFTDNCDENLDVTMASSITEQDCGFIIEKTWTAIDDCGNSVTATQTITVVDTEAPVITFQTPDQTIECDEEIPAINVTFVDNCDEDLTIVVDNYTNPLDCGFEYVKWCSATDYCGNTTEALVTITVLDTEAPVVLSAPQDVTIECDQPEPTDEPVFSDNCDENFEVVAASSISQLDCGFVIEKSWTATDDCGNSTTVNQTITVTDTTAPELNGVPADEIVECTDIPAAAMVTATDNCDDSVEVFFTESVEMLDCGYLLIRTWSATDNCGNDVSEEQVITVTDTVAPEFAAEAADATVECDNIPDAPELTATDACDDNVEVAFTEEMNPVDDCIYEIIRTWTAIDDCGNSVVETQILTVQDTTPPTADGEGVTMDIDCGEDVPESTLSFSDNCDNNLEVTVHTQLQPLDCTFQYIQVVSATDDCGNTTSVTNIYTVVDEEAPVLIGVPADATIDCTDEAPDAIVVAQDNCDEDVEVSLHAETVYNDCGYEIVRTWSATDDCGNTVSQTQTLTVTDTEAPIFEECPAPYVVNCDNGSSAPEFAGEPVVSDNCSEFEVTFEDGLATDECPATFTRTWIATDACGNMSTCEQEITINDFAAPEITCPADVTIECTESTDPSNTGVATATDDCSEPTISFEDNAMMGDCPYTIERTWTAVDPCGNTSTCVQVITIVDTEAPVLSGEDAEVTIECDMTVDLPEIAATDNCDEDVAIELTSVTIDGDCPQNFTEVYTWTATDECGNQSVRTFTVNYEDTTAPILIGVPADATIDCTDEVPNAIVAAQDNCDNDVEVSLTAETVYSDCGYEIVRTWSATDDCGNTVSQTQTLTVVDTTPPVFEECPSPYVVNCDNGSSAPEFAGEPVVSDACSELTVTFEDGVATDECPATFTRTWIATDACGNMSSCEQEITINDFGDPIIDCPADITIECTESTDPSNTGMATATDDCSVPVITYVDGPITGDCPYTFERIFTATDACGNSSSSVQVITIVDTEAPVLSGEDAEITSECDQQVALPVVTATDNCDEDVEVIFSSELIEGDCAQSFTEVYTWVATDECGNQAVRVLTVNYVDTTAPELIGVPVDITAECDDVPAAAVVSANDNCDEDVEVFFSEAVEMLDCGYILTRTWSATDDCGNNSMASQTVTVVDTTDPMVVSAPADVTLECDQPEPTDMPVFADNCDDDLDITAISGITNVTDCGFTIERSWTATDDCGNATTVSQTITFIDTTAPVLIDVPANTTVECTAIPQAPMVSANDNCDDAPVVTMTETLGGGCPYTITRTWIATDACGNQSTASQIITVIDEEAPVLVGVPEDFVGECGDAPAADQVFATDNCDEDVPVVLTEEVIGEECPLTIIRTWTAIDNCGNTTSASQTITINDTTAPIFTDGPADATVECDMVPGVDNDAIVVEDNCDINLAISFNETIEPGEPVMEGGEPCGYTIFRTWTATDDCGNSSSFTQTITVVDTTAPDLVGVPEDVTVECTDIPDAPVVTAVDNCYDGDMVVTFEESILPADCGYQIVRTWVVEDNCWNYNSESQVITVVDTVDPIVVSTPADVTIECDEALPTSMPVFDDACDDDLTVTMTETEQPQNCGFLVIRTWTATDDCGNSVSTSQSIFVTDTTAPVFDAEASDMEVECSNIPAAIDLTATDNCDDMVEVTFSEEILPGECPYTIIRTWIATDDCGNSTIETQTLTVVDTEAPILIGVPADATVECDAIPGVDAVTATDNCDSDLEVSFADQIIANQGCGYSIIRTWTVADNCGNTASATQTLTVVDTTAPEVVSTPADLALECDEEVPMASAEFTDNCDDDLTIGFNETVVPGVCENSFTIIRTWTAVDDCGNETSTSQNIVISDTTAPVLVGVPSDVTAECDAVPGAAQVSATDNCDLQVMVTLTESITALECGYLLTRTWTATDNCGNTASASQVVTVVDTTAPVAMSVPQPITIECDQQIPDAMPMFTDNCDDDLEIVAASSISQLECGELIERSWTATDDCGNSTTVSQTITVVDTTAPIFVSVPADATVECDAVPAPAQVFAEDNCDENLVILFEESIVEEGCPYTIERTWTVFDNCDNSTSYTQTLTVVDTTDPILVGVPADATVECDAVPAAATVTAEDNCADNLEVFFTESVEMLDCGYILTRVWSTTDECGNSATATQVLTVVDTTAPVLIGVPEDVVAECDAVPAPAIVTAEDNCDTDLQVTLVEEEVEQECGYLLIRTWSVHDSCNNTASGTQVITVTDTTAPVIVNAPADIMVQCDALPGIGNVIAEDNCDPVVDITVTESTEDIACGFILTRTFTATDDCGNSSVHVQTITVEDTEAPVIVGVPADVTIECGEPVPAPGQVDVTDNCDPMPMISTSEVTEDLDCGFQIVRTYIATDECGNQSTAQQIITVSDFTAPVFENVPQDAEVNCNEVTIAPTLTAIDNCDDNVEVIFSEVIGDGCPYTIERTWTAIDDCGNEASVTQTLTVTDDEAPVFEDFPFFTQVECDEVDAYMPAAFDNCDAEVEVIIVSELTFSGGCLGVLDRTYQAIDNCGNVTETSQLIQVIDVTAPELFNIPEDLELACGDEIPAPAADVFATDNCTAEVEIIFTEEQSNEFCPYTITRTWTAIDDCGNETVATQTITVTVEVDNFNVSVMSYPNPMDDRFTVEFTVPLDAQVRAGVYDMTGREVLPVFEGEADARRLYQLQYGDLNWKAGTYILMLTVDGEVYHHKIIVTQQ